MIQVAPAAEPERFDSTVRQPGLAAIRELVGEPPIKKRPDSKREKIAASRDAIPADAFPPFWREALDDMLGAYKRLCAYSCLGGGSVDHMLPKSTHWDHVYEWSNYRLACMRMNTRKNEAADVVDPFEVGDGWFALEFDECQVICGPGIDVATAAKVEATRTRLGLNELDCLKARQEYVRSYRDGEIPLDYLERRAPFIARELRRQGKLRTGDV